jgi:hypothetical protein
MLFVGRPRHRCSALVAPRPRGVTSKAAGLPSTSTVLGDRFVPLGHSGTCGAAIATTWPGQGRLPSKRRAPPAWGCHGPWPPPESPQRTATQPAVSRPPSIGAPCPVAQKTKPGVSPILPPCAILSAKEIFQKNIHGKMNSPDEAKIGDSEADAGPCKKLGSRLQRKMGDQVE